jgi:hypothetical protein
MTSDLERLMQEPAGGHNHGRRRAPDTGAAIAWQPLGDAQTGEFLREAGWTVAREKDPTASGMSAHRGVLQEDEYVDPTVVEALVEDALGFSFDQLHSVYSTGGRIPADRVELRGRIDARLLALAESGANMDLFGRVTRLNASTLDRALTRARSQEVK